MSKSARYISSVTNRTSVYGIMGGLANRRRSGTSSMNRVTSRLAIPSGAAAGLQYMRMHNLLSVNPQCSGGVGHINHTGCRSCDYAGFSTIPLVEEDDTLEEDSPHIIIDGIPNPSKPVFDGSTSFWLGDASDSNLLASLIAYMYKVDASQAPVVHAVLTSRQGRTELNYVMIAAIEFTVPNGHPHFSRDVSGIPITAPYLALVQFNKKAALLTHEPDLHGFVAIWLTSSPPPELDCSYGNCTGISTVKNGCIMKGTDGSFCCTDDVSRDGLGCNNADKICAITTGATLCGRTDISSCCDNYINFINGSGGTRGGLGVNISVSVYMPGLVFPTYMVPGTAWVPSDDCSSSIFPCKDEETCCEDPKSTKKGTGLCYDVDDCAILGVRKYHTVLHVTS